jgi:hypothetical protein
LAPGFLEEGGSPGYGRWVPGALETNLFGNAKVLGKERWTVHAYRCTRCSHLELLATEPGN